jgi:hypothetical protein
VDFADLGSAQGGFEGFPLFLYSELYYPFELNSIKF